MRRSNMTRFATALFAFAALVAAGRASAQGPTTPAPGVNPMANQFINTPAPGVNPMANQYMTTPAPGVNPMANLTPVPGLTPQPGKPQMYRLGVYTQPVNLSPAGYQPVMGLYVTSVVPGGAAAAIGLEPGDVITRVNNMRVQSQAELVRAVQTAGGPTTIRIRNVRTNQFQDMPVTPTYY